MYQLIYISVADEALEETAIKGILEKSVKTNTDLEVTGILLFNGLNFLQVLEGPKDTVISLYARIISDPKHRGVTTILEKPVARRNFSDWSMRLKVVPCDAVPLPAWVNFDEKFLDTLPSDLDSDIFTILKSFNTLRG